MNCQHLQLAPRCPSRSGFTLVELLAVIVVMSILVALLLPAIQGVRNRAAVVQVRSEISSLEAAITNFKTDFGIDPPSGIVLHEVGANWNSTNANTVRSRALIRQMWPQFDFSLNRDINQDGDADDTFELGGAECLVFFLGGILQWNDANGNGTRDLGGQKEDQWIPTGFSKNPMNPFALGGNRQGPYYQFEVSRMIGSPLTATAPAIANPNFYGYADAFSGQQSPLIYLSSYDGRGYRVTDLGSGGLVDIYRQGTTASSPAWNPKKYQIISPGRDGRYGRGGPWLADKASTLLVGDRADEEDNVTNFSQTVLIGR